MSVGDARRDVAGTRLFGEEFPPARGPVAVGAIGENPLALEP